MEIYYAKVTSLIKMLFIILRMKTIFAGGMLHESFNSLINLQTALIN